ncbi:hypothetical protein J7E71_25855 [Mesobacillus foraminis]|nr:hypothetical protein [Mesobacillus foraminis]MBT2759296.1 hypothetical protein [Mesobacillus foraminis]
MTQKFTNNETEDKIWEAIGMTTVFKKQFKELEEQRDIEKLEQPLKDL